MRKICLNGEILPESEAKVSVYDSALMFGDTVFEMTRSFKHKHFRLRDHLERLFRSIMYLRIPFDYTIDDVEQFCHAVTEANPFSENDEHRLMINISRGVLPIYREAAPLGTNLIITDFPLRWTTAGMGELFNTGINCAIPSQRTIPAPLLEPKVKNRSRIHYLMANIEVSRLKGENNWALLLDPDGYITEGTGCNFFIVKDSLIMTPEPRNILRGVSREFILEVWPLAFEKNIEPYDVFNADEAFVTGTPFCMLPVVSLDGIRIGNGKPGPIYTKLLEHWGLSVGVNIKEQIQEWDKGAVNGTSPYKFH